MPRAIRRTNDPNKDERYTLNEEKEWCLAVANIDKYDLDVAACEQSHLAEKYYTKDDNGLVRPWFGNVWCNCPYSLILPWVEKAWLEWEKEPGIGFLAERPKTISLLLPSGKQDQPWFQDLVEPYRDGRGTEEGERGLTTHYLSGRRRFASPTYPEGIPGSPFFGLVLLLWRR